MIAVSATAEDRLSELRALRHRLIVKLQRWPEERLHFQPASGGWCVLQMLDHILLTEEAFPLAVRLSLPQKISITARDRLGRMMVNTAMLSPRRIKVPAAATAVLPGEPPSLQVLLNRWQRNDALLDRTLTNVSPEQRSIGAFRHPVAGWMNLADGIGFLLAHFQHHQFQYKRIARASSHLSTV